MVRISKKPTTKKPSSGGGEGFEPPSISDPQKGLVPIGNSPFYATPSKPASPFDCDRYANSIYCGGVPWTETPIGIEPAIVLDDCNIGIELTPVLGWTMLPPLQIVYRRNTKECRNPKPDKEFVEPTDLKDYDVPLKFRELGCSSGVSGAICTEVEFYSEYCDVVQNNYGYNDVYSVVKYIEYMHNKLEILEINFPFKTKYKYRENETPAYFHMKVRITNTRSFNKIIDKFSFGLNDNVGIGTGIRPSFETGSYISDVWIHQDQDIISIDLSTMIGAIDINNEYGNTRLYKDFNRGIYYLKQQSNKQRFRVIEQKLDRGFKGVNVGYLKILKTPLQLCIDEPKIYFPPIPRKKECDCEMTCCPDTKLNDQLLKMLIKKVDKLSSIVGVDDYPVSLPASLISKDEGFLGNLIPNQNMDVPSLTRFLAWYVERFDEIMGQWEIPIEIKDSDPSKPGDQPLGVKLPNMAEAIAEMFTLIFQTNLNSETLLNFAVRTAAEGVADKQQNFITYKLMQSMAEWAGYKQKDISLKMPSLFSLSKTRYDEILNESEIDVPCVDFDEKFGLEADLMRFREAVAILQAVYKKKVDPSSDIKEQILKHLLDAFAAVNKVNGKDDDQDFKKFLTDVENGFINTPGANETTEPYGRPYKERPKIRDLTNYEPPTSP